MEDEQLRLIQKCCLGIVSDIDRVCRSNKIAYSLCGGSVIGAHLYQGFIPWDDDIDLMMTRSNYDRFLKIYPKKCAPYYHLRHYSTDGVENLPSLFSRVEDCRTQVTEEIAGGIRQGRVFVDITVFDEVSSTAYYRLIRLYAGFVYTGLYRMNGMTPGRVWWKKALFQLLPRRVSQEKLIKRYQRLETILRKHSADRAPHCAEILSAAFSGILYDRKLFDQYRDIQYEGAVLMIIGDYMTYLQTRYGRSEFPREMPKEQQQETHIKKVTMKEEV